MSTWPSRFVAAGYVVAVVTYRSRDVDPQSFESVQDALAAIEHLRQLHYVDRASIVFNGASGGGDLALWVASSTEIAAIVTEEPASSIFMGMFNKQTPKKVERFSADDAFPIHADPKKFFTAVQRADFDCRAESCEQNARRDELSWRATFIRLYSVAARTPHPAVAAKVFEDVNVWLRRHLRTQPSPMRADQVQQVLF